MAENEKQTVQAEQTDIAEQEKKRETERFNRQINYFIMRYMWQVIRGRKREDGDTIYSAFNTSRERYTRIINTGIVRYGRGELDGLEQITGLRKEIFTGEVRFKCPYVVKPNVTATKKDGKQEESIQEETIQEETIQEDITQDEWEALFTWRKQGRTAEGTNEAKQDSIAEGTNEVKQDSTAESTEKVKEKTCQDAIYDKLRLVARDNTENWDFYRLCFYLKHMKAAPLRESTGKLRELESLLKELSFTLLDGYEVGQLQELQRLLKQKQTIVSAIVAYKNARDSERQK